MQVTVSFSFLSPLYSDLVPVAMLATDENNEHFYSEFNDIPLSLMGSEFISMMSELYFWKVCEITTFVTCNESPKSTCPYPTALSGDKLTIKNAFNTWLAGKGVITMVTPTEQDATLLTKLNA